MQKKLSFFNDLKKLQPILTEIEKKGGVSYLVGGSVRDLLLGCEVKDIDIEVHKLSLEKLQEALQRFGIVKLVGKQFGVLRINKFDVDWSLPRKDSIGRKPEVEIDPNLTIEAACRRRDLTINAMAINLNKFDTTLRYNFLRFAQKITQGERVAMFVRTIRLYNTSPLISTIHLRSSRVICFASRIEGRRMCRGIKDYIIDPFGGQKDLKEKKLRAVDNELFLQDPLRFFRVMQFIGRFEMQPDKNLNDLCKNMDLSDIQTGRSLSKERVFEEIKKLFLKSKKPSLGFRWLKDLGRLREVFPELYALLGVEQRADYHPEGDVFEHTMQALDASAVLNKYENDEEKFAIMLGALCHDLGKPQTTDKELHAFGHEKVGVDVARFFLKRFVQNKELIKFVCKLVLYHTLPGALIEQKASLKAYKKLAIKLSPQVSMRQIALVTLADLLGRNPKGHEPLKNIYEKEYELFLQKARNAQVEHEAEKPVLHGQHLMDVVAPGPEMGRLLKKAYEIQIDEGIKDVDELKCRVINHCS